MLDVTSSKETTNAPPPPREDPIESHERLPIHYAALTRFQPSHVLSIVT